MFKFLFLYLQGQTLPGVSSMKQYPSSGRGGRNQVPNRAVVGELADGASFDSLIGRRVRTKWPDDNNFYEAVIADYNPVDVFTALIYLGIHFPLRCI